MDDLEVPIIRPLIWLGNSKKNVLSFPNEVKKLLGDELQLIQFGGMPKNAKPFKGVGSGVIEIAIKYDKDAYRCIQAVQLGKIYMFSTLLLKNQKKGSKLPNRI